MTTPALGTSERSPPTCAAACRRTLLAVALVGLAAPVVGQPSITTYQSGTTTTFEPLAQPSAGAAVAAPSAHPIEAVTRLSAQASITRYQSGTTTTFSAPAQFTAGYGAARQSVTSTVDPKGRYRVLPMKGTNAERTRSMTTAHPQPQRAADYAAVSAGDRQTQQGAPPVAAVATQQAQALITKYQSGTTTTFGPPLQSAERGTTVAVTRVQ